MASFQLALSMDEDTGDFIKPSSNLDDLFSEFMRDSPPESGNPSDERERSTPKEEPPETEIKLQTLTAKVVYAYKLINNENAPQGRVGLAIVQHAATEMRLILYRSKQDVLATLTLLTPGSTRPLHIKPHQYLQFRDDGQHFWSVCFDSASDRSECVQAIGDQHCVNEETPTNSTADPIPADNTTIIVEAAGTSSAKPSLVSRMAKMGQQLPQVQPRQQHVADESSSDSDAMHDQAQGLRALQAPHPMTTRNTHSTTTATTKWKPTIASRPGPGSSYTTPMLATTNTLIAYNPPASATGANLDAVDLLAHFTETRMQNTEVRMNLSKLESRIDRVLDKIDALPLNVGGVDRNATPRSDVEGEIIALEERMLALRKENRELRRSCEASGAVNDEAMQTERAKCKALQEDSAVKDRMIGELQQELLKTKGDLESQIEMHEQSIQTNSQEVSDLKALIQTQQTELDEARLHNNESNSHVPDTERTVETIKSVLNQFYHNFQARINESTDLSNDQLLKLVRSLIKTEAQNILKDM